MATERHIYGKINNQTDLQKVFSAIRRDVEGADSRPALTELYKRAGYLITLIHAPSWEKKFGPEAAAVRKTAEHEFSATVQQINRRARQIGTEPDYDETWGEQTGKAKRSSSMPKQPRATGYRPTEAKYRGGAKEMYVTYDLPQKTRGETVALYPKVKRVYIAGEVKDWRVGTFAKRSGRRVHGVQIAYAQRRAGYSRKGYTATRGRTHYAVSPAPARASTSTFAEVVELPQGARHIQFHAGKLPAKYRSALQAVR